MIKKVLSLLMATLMVSSLAACGGSGSSAASSAGSAAASSAGAAVSEAAEEAEDTAAAAASEAEDTAAAAASSAEEAAPAAASGDQIKVGVSFHSLMNDVFKKTEEYLNYWKDNPIEDGYPTIDMTITVADSDINKQISDVKDLISQNPDVILIDPADSTAIEPAVKACHDAGIPCVTYNRPIAEEVKERPDAECLVDAYAQGYDVAKAVFDKMQADGVEQITVVMCNGETRDNNSILRANGVKDAAEEYGATIAAELPCDWDPSKVSELLPSALTGNPDTNLVYCATDGMLSGIKSTLEAIDRWAPYGEENHMYLASCDVFEEGYNMIADGYVDADTLFDVKGFVGQAVKDAYALAAGESVEGKTELVGACYTQDNYQDEELTSDLWWQFEGK
ncbi:MAG: sugar ABC transporter substrate-binding protein [Eubacterium sp.]|nr:sugar ABC transporter substrate-binding protein [Eubacterium sp.]